MMSILKKLASILAVATVSAFPLIGLNLANAQAAAPNSAAVTDLSHPAARSVLATASDDMSDIIKFPEDEEVMYQGGQKDVSAAAPFIRDHSEIFSAAKIPTWEKQLRDLANKYGIAPYVVTVDDFNRLSPEQWGANYYNANKLGLDPQAANGVIMIINPSTRDVWFLGHGKGQQALTPYGIDKIYERVTDPLGDDNWDGGMEVYLHEIADYLEQWKAGTPYSKSHPVPARMTLESTLWGLGIALGVGALSGYGVMALLERKHHTAQKQAGASSYIVPGSNQITGSEEVFVRSYVTQVARPKESKSSSSGTFSSGGTSFSSGGGKF